MTTNRAEETWGVPTVNAGKGLYLIDKQIAAADILLQKDALSEEEFSAWDHTTQQYLEMAFGKRTANVRRVIGYGSVELLNSGSSISEPSRRRVAILTIKLSRLRTERDILITRKELEPTTTPDEKSAAGSELRPFKRVFIVHGHDDAAKTEVARFVENLGLEAIILHEQTNQGRTIIEKFADHANDAGYAIVIMSPDDRGRSAKDTPDKERPRARQNVILELGYFLAKLDRNRVTALLLGDVEIPGDISGVVYEKMDTNGAWKYAMGRELQDAGFAVDLNKIK